ncbi:hypothetical protein BC937DRAFT_94152 [Endogone sp. FLAS-F59071]|nr:hypothetical protein BC937DRAFT_94152 [Endogone sp. FLAS-F59071]|eukprot:RUS14232.1 hypothetical protein BC937DRAFT_94152 [Endogone sp. FLAS-F59071]
MLFGIATEIVGIKIEPKALDYVECLEIVEALSAIHHHGILHNDIRKENILIQHSNGGFRISFIDFAFSERTSDKEKLSQEMANLKYLLSLSLLTTISSLKKSIKSTKLLHR